MALELWPLSLALVATAVMEDGMRLLALVDSPNHVCCRYRIRAFAASLEAGGLVAELPGSERQPAIPRLAQLYPEPRSYDSVILAAEAFARVAASDSPPRYARHLVFDFDDAVLFPRLIRSPRSLLLPAGGSGLRRWFTRPTR